VDDSVHPADVVDLIGEFSGLGCAAEVAGDDSCGVRGEVTERRGPLAGAGVENNVMAFTYQGSGGGAAEPVGGAGDEDTGHGIIPPLSVLVPDELASRSPLATAWRNPGRELDRFMGDGPGPA
jgi:hypothetical protein